jgi:hypothetical protein
MDNFCTTYLVYLLIMVLLYQSLLNWLRYKAVQAVTFLRSPRAFTGIVLELRRSFQNLRDLLIFFFIFVPKFLLHFPAKIPPILQVFSGLNWVIVQSVTLHFRISYIQWGGGGGLLLFQMISTFFCGAQRKGRGESAPCEPPPKFATMTTEHIDWRWPIC